MDILKEIFDQCMICNTEHSYIMASKRDDGLITAEDYILEYLAHQTNTFGELYAFY